MTGWWRASFADGRPGGRPASTRDSTVLTLLAPPGASLPFDLAR
jgi:hypothetical protein